MLRIILNSNEFNSNSEPNNINGCNVGNILLSKTDERYLSIINFNYKSLFELIVINPKFRSSKSTGCYRFGRCVRCGWNESVIQINYWELEKLDYLKQREFIIDFLV